MDSQLTIHKEDAGKHIVERNVRLYLEQIAHKYQSSGSTLPLNLWILSQDAFYAAPDPKRIEIDQMAYGGSAEVTGLVDCIGIALDNGIICHIGPFGDEHSTTVESNVFRKEKAGKRIELLQKLSGSQKPQNIIVANPSWYNPNARLFHNTIIDAIKSHFTDSEILFKTQNSLNLRDFFTNR